jgi:Family of unknown function (DUF6504)
MRPIRAEPVDVWLRHGRPARFVWRGRLYVVLFVLDRRLSLPPAPAAPPEGAGDQPPGHEHWLVEASAQQATAPGTYELTRDLATDRWTLSRN